MSTREAFEAHPWAKKFSFKRGSLAGGGYREEETKWAFYGFRMRNDEIAAKDARIAELEAALKRIDALERMDAWVDNGCGEYVVAFGPDEHGAFMRALAVKQLTKEALR